MAERKARAADCSSQPQGVEPDVLEYRDEQARLRDLERRVRDAKPGSPEYEHAADELDRVTRLLMDRYRGSDRAEA